VGEIIVSHQEPREKRSRSRPPEFEQSIEIAAPELSSFRVHGALKPEQVLRFATSNTVVI
jgi:hypothetical protein